MTELPSSSLSSPSSTAGGGKEERISATFGGTAGEYFRIWLVNALLTIITIGFYSPWAKVRNKRYFYGNAWLGDANFEYHAKPLAILIARLVLLAIFFGGAIWAGEDIVRNSYYSLALLVLLPWAIVRGLSFNARNSSFAGMRFSFVRDYLPVYLIYLPFFLYSAISSYYLIAFQQQPGGLEADGKEMTDEAASALLIYFGIAGFGFLLLLLFVPFLVRAYHRYKAGRHKLGNLRFSLNHAPIGEYYKATILPYFIIWFFLAVIVFGTALVLLAGGNEEAGEVAVLVFFIMTALSFFILAQVIQAMLFRLFWHNLRAGNESFAARFVCDIDIWHFAFNILLVNTLASVVSLGLLHPWAKVRKTKYIVKHIHIIAPAGVMSSLAAREDGKESALGEELDVAEGFDFDVGLI